MSATDLISAPSFGKQLQGEWSLVSLELGTCCDRAASQFAGGAFSTPPRRLYASSFPDAILMAAATASIVLLPHVHHTCSDLTTAPDWELLSDFAFPLANPPLLLARSAAGAVGAPGRCASIERLVPLLSAEERARLEFSIVPTTQAAARTCADGTTEYCITNEHGCRHYGLELVRELKRMVIWWMPFKMVPVGENR